MKNNYSKEEIRMANSYSLPDLLRRDGYILVPERKGEYHLQEHDSLKISDHSGWKWFSRNIGGKNIDFFMKYEGMDFLHAVDKIFALSGHVLHEKETEFAKEPLKPVDIEIESRHDVSERREFVAPAKNENNRRVYAYLVKTRCLNPKIVSGLLNSGYLYESAVTHNAVFLGTNYDGNIDSSLDRKEHTSEL